jgi:dATP pyrophosphohydrolase
LKDAGIQPLTRIVRYTRRNSMGRAPFQVLIFPYRRTSSGDWEFAVFHRSDLRIWQGIAGGGEDDESPLDAARRESFEEAGIPANASFIALQTTASIKAAGFRESFLCGEELFVVPEISFGVHVPERELTLSSEHVSMRWLSFSEAERLLRFDSNRTALWELN